MKKNSSYTKIRPKQRYKSSITVRKINFQPLYLKIKHVTRQLVKINLSVILLKKIIEIKIEIKQFILYIIRHFEVPENQFVRLPNTNILVAFGMV